MMMGKKLMRRRRVVMMMGKKLMRRRRVVITISDWICSNENYTKIFGDSVVV